MKQSIIGGLKMSVDEMIVMSINCLENIEEHFKTQMIAWVRVAADFGKINDELVKENEQLKIKIKALESANKAMVKEIDDMSNGGIDVLIKIAKLKEENEQVKKTAIVWHKVTCFDEPDENGYVTASNPAEEGKEYLLLLKNKRIVISELACDSDGYFFEDFDWEDIEAWAECKY